VAAIDLTAAAFGFKEQHPRHRHCFQLTHRFDAAPTAEVAL